ncbi:hypothetical protein BJ875DRAFT_220784 [Amylocarpus encephaloides]|uniref:PH domain-like protein n=1 Tax=Amylocarpus encephaloides TaxID=45428 RepID=A0A9P8C9V7_9HELO|nr:hypothetical protein BJ875DRAFT_220784 [Amylocarpus encephaloides]
MTPRKTRGRHQQNTSQSIPVQASDYESEAFYEPHVTTRSNTELNLAVLRRYHPSIQSILSIAPSAQIYTYVPESSSWNKTDIEGTLFVCQLAPATLSGRIHYCIVVLNRRGLDNLIMNMAAVENVEITGEFLMIGVRSSEDPNIRPEEGAEMKTLGFFIHADKLDTREVNCQLIKEKWEEEGAQRHGEGATEPQKSEATDGRKLNLADLFGSQG